MRSKSILALTAPTVPLSNRYRTALAHKVDKANYDVVRAMNSASNVKPHAADFETHGQWRRAIEEHQYRMRRLQSVADEFAILACLIDG